MRLQHYDGIDCRLFLWMRQQVPSHYAHTRNTHTSDAIIAHASQHVFFVCTAPAAPPGGAPFSPNISPKGLRGTLAVLGPRSIAYLDSYGSGVETIVHTEQVPAAETARPRSVGSGTAVCARPVASSHGWLHVSQVGMQLMVVPSA